LPAHRPPPRPGRNTMGLFSRKSKPAPAHPSSRPSTPAAYAPSATPATSEQDEQRILTLGEEMLSRARSHKSGLLSARFYSDKLMNWSMSDQNFKVQLFRFVDCFPALTSPEMIHDHLTDYLTQPGVKLPPGFDLGLKAGG